MNLPKEQINPWENARRHAAARTMPATPMPQNARAVSVPAGCVNKVMKMTRGTITSSLQ